MAGRNNKTNLEQEKGMCVKSKMNEETFVGKENKMIESKKEGI